jgi:hypothetical protein
LLVGHGVEPCRVAGRCSDIVAKQLRHRHASRRWVALVQAIRQPLARARIHGLGSIFDLEK